MFVAAYPLFSSRMMLGDPAPAAEAWHQAPYPREDPALSAVKIVVGPLPLMLLSCPVVRRLAECQGVAAAEKTKEGVHSQAAF